MAKRSVTAALLLLCGCATVPPEVTYPLEPGAKAPVDWPAVFSKPTALQVIPLYTGDVEVDRSMVLNLEHEALEDREDRTLWVPVMAYLVRHPTQGSILIDSGMDSCFAESGSGNLHGLAHFADPFRQQPGSDTVALLKKCGVAPQDLKMVLISHMHVDHTAGLPELSRSVPLVAGPNATEGYDPLWYAPWDHLDGYPQVQTLDFSSAPDKGPGRTLDLFGDGSLFVIDAPGHVPGNLSFLLNATGGPILLTVDACHTGEGWDKGVEPGELVVDRDAAVATLSRLRAFAAKYPKMRVFQGHEARNWDLTRAVQAPLE